jgi:UDP-N-acetylmuramate--alanine ligase
VIAEADEFDRSFLQLNPHLAIITAVDPDHLDIYRNKESFEQAFIEFASNVDKDGLVLISNTIENDLLKHQNIKTFGIEGEADFSALNIKALDFGYEFDIQWPNGEIWEQLQLGISGLINVNNALAASVLAREAGITEEAIRGALASFSGIKRRFDIWFDNSKNALVDDYAHHPKEILALYKGLKHKFGTRKLVAIFQPHLFSRTNDFAPEFAEVLSKFDVQILLPIYPARELPMEGVSSEIIFNQMDSYAKHLLSKDETADFIKNDSQNAIYVTIGAGDIDRELEYWVDLIKDKTE